MNQRSYERNQGNAYQRFTNHDGKTYLLDRRRRLYRVEAARGKKHDQSENRVGPFSRLFSVDVRRDWWTFGITTVISLATFWIVALYTLYVAQQAHIAEGANFNFMKSSRDSVRTTSLTLGKMETQALAMKTSAAAARDSVKATRDQMQLEDRAWVGFSGFSPQLLAGPMNAVLPNAPPAYQTFTAVLLNSGKTPAREVEVTAAIDFRLNPHILNKGDEAEVLKLIDKIDAGEIKPDPSLNHLTGGNVVFAYNTVSLGLGLLIFQKARLGVLSPGIPAAFQVPHLWSRGGSEPDETIALGRLKYIDTQGVARFTAFCTYRSKGPDGTLRSCPILNDMQ